MLVRPKKRLGQNFLIDRNIQSKIIDACELNPCDIVLEIGAGRGELTCLLANKVKSVYAFEIDSGLCEILNSGLKEYPNVKVINQDILKFNFKRAFSKIKNKIKIVGNIPYYITTPIIEFFLKYSDKIDVVFITVQKEFAQRMIADCSLRQYGSLSCFVQYYTSPRILFQIKKNCFYPAPKVDSSFLRLEIKEKLPKEKKKEKMLFRLIRAAFNQRRKTLRNSLKGVISQGRMQSFFNKYQIDCNVRPEKLSLKDFENLIEIGS